MKFLKSAKNKFPRYTAKLKTRYDNFTVLSSEPFLGYIDNIFDNSDIENVLAHIENATESDWNTLERKIDQDIDSNYLNINRNHRINLSLQTPVEGDVNIRKTVSELCGLPEQNCEKTILGKYLPGMKLPYHCDSVEFSDQNNLLSFSLTGGQRILTAILYLSDNFTGGETHFDQLNITVTPRKGRLLLFHNVAENANIPDYRTSHCSNLVTEGIKYTATFWFRINAIDWQLMQDISNKTLSERQNIHRDVLKNLSFHKQTVQFIR